MSTNNCIHNLVEDEAMGHRVCTKCGQVNLLSLFFLTLKFQIIFIFIII